MSASPRLAYAARPWRGVAIVLAAMALVLLVAAPAFADRDYTVRFTRNAQGDITGTGNTLLTCRDDDPRCAAARAGTANGADNNNNNLPMRYVDIDDDPATFNSSAATLALPPGARILFAGLYYGGRLQAGTGPGASPAPNPGERNQVLFRPPDLGAYIRLTASQVDDAPVAGPQTYRLYQGFVDVTDIVRSAGAGEYTVGNVQLGTGQDADEAGGWALAVAYEDANQPTRNLTIFDGFKFVLADGPPVDIPLSGFVTPRSGTVSTRVGLVAIEGDLGTTGDSATLNAGLPTARLLTNAANPPNNFFNASISSRDGTSFQLKRPNYRNQLGYDADVFDATGFLSNGQTATTLRLATSGDGFAPQGVSFSTDLFAPSLHVVKAVDKPVAAPGDVLTYTVDVSNVGLDAATQTTLRDAIPAGTQYVPGSLSIVSGANAGTKTDAAGDDQAEFDGGGNSVVMRLGTGATAANGGVLAINASTSVRFQVRVNDPVPVGFVVRNNAGVGYVSDTLQQPGNVTSPDVLTEIRVPDLAITKSHTGEYVSGRTVPFTLDVRNVGDGPTRGVTTVTDQLPDEMTFVTQPSGPGWSCSTEAHRLTCTRSDTLAPGAAFPTISYTARVASGTPAAQLVNTAVVSNPSDGNDLNNTDTEEGDNRPPSIDLAIDKIALTPLAFPGQEVRFRLRVTNLGRDTATRVVVRDIVPPGLTPVSATPSRGSCAGPVCRLGRIRHGQIVTIELTALAGRDTGGRTLVNRAVVRGRETDDNLANNRDRAPVRIIPLVDIVVRKLAASPTVTAGGNASYVVIVRNDGPSDATDVRVRDLFPPALTPLSATPTQGTCPTPTACNLGAIEAGEAAQIVLVAGVSAESAGQTLVNGVAAFAREPDSDLANNFAIAQVTATAPVVPPGDVVVTKRASEATVGVGDTFTYTLTATNRGPGSVPSAVVTDAPDANLTVVSVTPSSGTCTTGEVIRCDLGPLAAGASATVIVTARATAAGPLRNSAAVLAPDPPTPGTTPAGPGSVTVAGVTVQSPPRVLLRKRADRRVVRSGGQVTFSLTATARGRRGTARNVTICDRLPRGFTVVSRGGAQPRSGRWCWRISALGVGSSRTVRIVTRARSVSRVTRVTNVATLASGDQPPRFARARVVIVPPNSRLTG